MGTHALVTTRPSVRARHGDVHPLIRSRARAHQYHSRGDVHLVTRAHGDSHVLLLTHAAVLCAAPLAEGFVLSVLSAAGASTNARGVVHPVPDFTMIPVRLYLVCWFGW